MEVRLGENVNWIHKTYIYINVTLFFLFLSSPFFLPTLDLKRKLKQTIHRSFVIYVNHINILTTIIREAIFTLALCQVSSHHFLPFPVVNHCFRNLKGWGLRVFCQHGYPCLTVPRLWTAITDKFIPFTLVMQRNINQSVCSTTLQLSL